MPATTGAFPNTLNRDINDMFFDTYPEVERDYVKIAKEQTAPAGDHFTISAMSGLGHLQVIGQGDAVTFDLPAEGNKRTMYYSKYGLGFQLTEELLKDDLTGNWKKMPQKLAKSAAIKPDVIFWNLFNNSFTSELSWDGQYIFDTDHKTLKSGQTIANRPATGSALSETTYQAACEYFDTAVDEAGMPIYARPWKIIVPSKLRATARKLRLNVGALGTANNDMNTANPDNGVWDPYDVMVARWLSSTTAWFVLAEDHDFNMLWKDRATLRSSEDFLTGNSLHKVTMRFLAYCGDYKLAYGNPGA